MRSPVLTRQGKTLTEMIMARETMSQKVISDHHPQPPPPTGHRSIQNSVVPAVSKPNLASPHITVRGCQEDFFRSETAANFYSVRAWPWRRADGGADCACARNGLILGGNAGRELTTVRWLVEFLTGYSENLLARSDSIHEKVGLTWITGTPE